MVKKVIFLVVVGSLVCGSAFVLAEDQSQAPLGTAGVPKQRNLALVDGERTLPQLVSLLQDAKPWTRAAAVKRLAIMGDRRALEPLQAMLTTEQDVRVAKLARMAVAKLEHKAAKDVVAPRLRLKGEQQVPQGGPTQ